MGRQARRLCIVVNGMPGSSLACSSLLLNIQMVGFQWGWAANDGRHMKFLRSTGHQAMADLEVI